jgi:K+-transporting ATPase KdpF subunit
MSLSTGVMLGISVLLVAYLLFALLRPEKL